MISIGDRLPDVTLRVMTPDGSAERTTAQVFGGRRVALFAVPGAFTPTCSNKHLPGFLAHIDDFKARGVDAVACLAVNDIFVLDAWARHTGAAGKIEFLADGNADFTRAAGLDRDGSRRGFGIRSVRYAMLADDGEVKVLLVEDVPGQTVISSAEALLDAIARPAA